MMLGKMVRGRCGPLALLALGIALVACAHTVSQDKATTEDGRLKGAREMVMENGEAKATGIVTYPGGDRVDWKSIELPEGKKGSLEIRLTWKPPRPGLQLAFDVYDEYNTKVGGSKRMSRKRARHAGHTKRTTIDGAKGKYFIRIYAVDRGDAGKYKLRAEFYERAAELAFNPLDMDVPDPPRLADIPEIVEGCDEFNFDVKNKSCRTVCGPGAPPGWPGCKGKCPTPPSVDEPACWATMPCPRPPDERVKACKPSNWPPCPNLNNPDQTNPNCRVKANPIVGRVIGKQIQGRNIFIQVSVGSDQGLKKDWTGTVIRGSDVNSPAFPGGEVRIIRIDKNVTFAKVRLTADQVDRNKHVRFSPP